MLHILVPLAPGFEEVEACTIIDLLRRAEVQVTTAAIGTSTQVKGSHGIAFEADTLLEKINAQSFEGVVLPGGLPGTTNLAECTTLGEMIKKHHNQGAWIAAICAAPTVLGRLGILKGKQATSYPGFEKGLEGAALSTDAVVQDGKVITSRGLGTAISFSLKLIEAFVSKAKADEISQGILYGG